ncbi:DUF262 domain-containing protein [Mycolicibacterium sp. CBM1]
MPTRAEDALITTALESVTESGVGSGIEVESRETDSDSARIEIPFDPDRIDVTTRTPTIDLILSRAASGAIDLEPDFQRKAGIWDNRRRSRLIESILLRIPLPTLYAAEDQDENWIIVDGIQRLTSIIHFCNSKLIGKTPLMLEGLEYLQAYEGMKYEDLPSKLRLRIRETELVLHVIRKGTPDPVKFNIFARINTGGMPLSNQELRHALISGPVRKRLHHLADSQEFIKATTGSVKDDRMADREMVLRYLAFESIDVKSYGTHDFDGFLTERMQFFNSMSAREFSKYADTFKQSMSVCHALFGKNAFRKIPVGNQPRMPINKALFEAESVSVAKLDKQTQDRLADKHKKCMTAMSDLMADPIFVNSISSGTGDIKKVRYRFDRIESMLRRLASD